MDDNTTEYDGATIGSGPEDLMDHGPGYHVPSTISFDTEIFSDAAEDLYYECIEDQTPDFCRGRA